MNADDVVARLRTLGSPRNVAGMARFGITPRTEVVGVSVTALRRLAREIGTDHTLARALWRSGVHEARVLATIIADPPRFTETLAERWVRSLDSWDVCDQFCMNLMWRVPFAARQALAWSEREEEFVKRAGFALMASLAVHERTLDDDDFTPLLAAIEREATDDRNFVRKAVSWALRQIGKRNRTLNRRAIATARRIARIDTRAARRIAAETLRELQSERVASALRRRAR